MFSAFEFFIILIIVFNISLLTTKYLITFLQKLLILDLPNERSNHQLPTPRGGGIGVLAGIFAGLLLVNSAFNLNSCFFYIALLSLILATISFLDDIKNVGVLIRFLIQLIITIIAVQLLPNDKLVFNGLLPFIWDRVIATISLIWFINSFNFMDGIDGIAGSESIHIALSIAVITLMKSLLPQEFIYYNLIIAISTLGFLIFNWHPAKIFMGDVGSIPLGLMLGWMLLFMAAQGLWQASLIIPAYYLADSTITIIKRLIEGKKIWQAHSEHFYQQAVRAGNKHSKVVLKIIMVNFALLVTAILSLYNPLISLIIGFLIVMVFLIILVAPPRIIN